MRLKSSRAVGLVVADIFAATTIISHAVFAHDSGAGWPGVACAYTYCVDSVHGNDSSSGHGVGAGAFRNLTRLPVLANSQGVGLARGSYWQNQMITEGTAKSVTVAAYGSGARPIIDGSARIINSSLASDGNGGYVTRPITFAFDGNGQGSGPWINVIERGGPGDPATGRLMINQPSQASVDATACSYYIPNMSTSNGTPGSASIYLHACDNSSPISNGYAYYYSNQRAAIYSGGGGYGTVFGIEGRNAIGKNGPFDFENVDGAGYTISDIMARNCGDHCIVVPGGTTISNSVFVDGYWGTLATTMVVVYEGIASGKRFNSIDNVFQVDQLPSNSGTPVAIISHSGNQANLGAISSRGDWFIGKNGFTLIGVSTQYNANTTLDGDYGSQTKELAQTNSTSLDLTVSHSQVVSSMKYNHFIQVEGSESVINTKDDKSCLSSDGADIYGASAYTGWTLNDNGSLWYKQSPNNIQLAFFLGNAATINVNGSIFDSALNAQTAPYNFYGTGEIFMGGSTTKTANSYNASHKVTHFMFNDVAVDDLSSWQRYVFPADDYAKTSGTAHAACTLPKIPTIE